MGKWKVPRVRYMTDLLYLIPFGTILELMTILVYGEIYNATETDGGFGKACDPAPL